MCGIAGVFGADSSIQKLESMLNRIQHRGPDDQGTFIDENDKIALGHTRLSILDLSKAGVQPMKHYSKKIYLVFNGEIYNYKELKQELSHYEYQSNSDSEVILAAYEKWGKDCSSHFIGMFSFMIWDEDNKTVFGARDRFGVKPLYYTQKNNTFYFSSEIKCILAAGIGATPNESTWANYLVNGLYEHTENTFFDGVKSLQPGHAFQYSQGEFTSWKWYDLSDVDLSKYSERPEKDLYDEYLTLLKDSIKLRFRADVPVGFNLSGGLDSSVLFGLVHQHLKGESDILAYTFITGDENYDELKWARMLTEGSGIQHKACLLQAGEIPDLALKIQDIQDEPYGGFPTLAYSKIFETARADGNLVLLDGQGLDEQWAGYEYYANADKVNWSIGPVQGSKSKVTRPDALTSAFLENVTTFDFPRPFEDDLRNLQYRDARYTKIPRALRFNDRVSMMSSTELREPFLDHRLFELAFSLKEKYKIRDGVHKYGLRQLSQSILPKQITFAPKRPLQTPQREWLKGELSSWVKSELDYLLNSKIGHWFNKDYVIKEYERYMNTSMDNSFFIWQWINTSLWVRTKLDNYGG